MSRKLLVIPLIIAFSGLLSAQTIEVTVTEGTFAINHTRPEVTDWIDGGLGGEDAVLNRKAGVAEQIILETVGQPFIDRLWIENISSCVRSWTDGTPVTVASGVDDSWYLNGVGKGFKVTVPAGTDNRRLHVYTGAYWSTCVLTATTSDGALYTSEAFYTEGENFQGPARHFMIDFQATSENETLEVTWILTEATGTQYGDVVAVTTAELIVSPALDVDETSIVIPERFNLSQNYPNPFNPTTMIQYDLPEARQVTIMVYDLTGRAVKTLVNEFKDVGNHSTTWDARDEEGNRMSGGVYLYSIQAGNYQKTQKMVLLK